MNKLIEETRVGVIPSSSSAANSKQDKAKEEKDTEKELASLIFDLESKQGKIRVKTISISLSSLLDVLGILSIVLYNSDEV